MFLSYIPSLAYILIAYNVVIFTDAALLGAGFTINLATSGAEIYVSLEQLFIILGLLALYIEVLKSARASSTSMIEHSFSFIVFIIFFAEFLMVKAAGTTTFLILTCMQMIDILSGFTIAVSAARRDVSINN
jgi:hypothetical protein